MTRTLVQVGVFAIDLFKFMTRKKILYFSYFGGRYEEDYFFNWTVGIWLKLWG